MALKTAVIVVVVGVLTAASTTTAQGHNPHGRPPPQRGTPPHAEAAKSRNFNPGFSPQNTAPHHPAVNTANAFLQGFPGGHHRGVPGGQIVVQPPSIEILPNGQTVVQPASIEFGLHGQPVVQPISYEILPNGQRVVQPISVEFGLTGPLGGHGGAGGNFGVQSPPVYPGAPRPQQAFQPQTGFQHHSRPAHQPQPGFQHHSRPAHQPQPGFQHHSRPVHQPQPGFQPHSQPAHQPQPEFSEHSQSGFRPQSGFNPDSQPGFQSPPSPQNVGAPSPSFFPQHTASHQGGSNPGSVDPRGNKQEKSHSQP